MDDNRFYLGNPLLKKSRVPINWTPELTAEMIKCSQDPIYFAEKYMKIVHVDKGFINVELYDYQREIILKFGRSRRVAVVTSRQAGKCVEKSTMVTVRNKKTGQIVEMSIEDFHKLAK